MKSLKKGEIVDQKSETRIRLVEKSDDMMKKYFDNEPLSWKIQQYRLSGLTNQIIKLRASDLLNCYISLKVRNSTEPKFAFRYCARSIQMITTSSVLIIYSKKPIKYSS